MCREIGLDNQIGYPRCLGELMISHAGQHSPTRKRHKGTRGPQAKSTPRASSRVLSIYSEHLIHISESAVVPGRHCFGVRKLRRTKRTAGVAILLCRKTIELHARRENRRLELLGSSGSLDFERNVYSFTFWNFTFL